ncbi:MAG: MarR family transcriptional regulator [Actinomycetota bacterium]
MTADQDRTAKVAELADALFTLMPMVATHVDDRLQKLGMTTTDWWALRSVKGPMPMKELASCMEIDPSYVTAVADRLEQMGLIERQPHPSDRRVKNLVLTTKGEEIKASIPTTLWSGPNLLAELTDPEHAQMLELVHKLVARAGGPTSAVGMECD